jgi:hypothetical protein
MRTIGRPRQPAKRRLPGFWPCGASLILLTALAAGCAHSDKPKVEERPVAAGGIPVPAPPVFLTGAMAPFFTNAEGFRAHAVLEGPPSATRREVISGELMGRGGRLFFAPDPGAPTSKRSHPEDFSYVWNVAEDRGFLLNGPLEGYAPISLNVQFTNLVVRSGAAAPEKVAGYVCQVSDVKATASDGAQTDLQVWRATELKGIPVRAAGTVNGVPVKFSLSKVRLEAPPEDLFLPPADFTSYASADLMVNELAARQDNQKRKRRWQPGPSDDIGARDVNGMHMP